MNQFSKVLDFIVNYDLNVIKTIAFNLRVFGFKKGCRMPVFLFGSVDIQNCRRGSIVLSSYSTCCVKIGGGINCVLHGSRPLMKSVINIKGKVFIGKHVIFGNGIILSVAEFGQLKIGDYVVLNVKNKIYCEREIAIGDSTRFSWESQLFDTNFHYTEKGGVIKYKNAPINIGHHVWIGNRVTISKGVSIPSRCIVSSNSFVNKTFSKIEERSLIGGIPAKYICSDIERIHDFGLEFWLDNYFQSTKEESIEVGSAKNMYNKAEASFL